MNRGTELLGIGAVAERSGLSVSAVRFYADHGLIEAERASSGHRRFPRATIRRLAFISVAQGLGYSLAEIGAQLGQLPSAARPAGPTGSGSAGGSPTTSPLASPGCSG